MRACPTADVAHAATRVPRPARLLVRVTHGILSRPRRRPRVRRVHRHLSGGVAATTYVPYRGRQIPAVSDAGPPRAHDPPADADRRPRADRRLVQLLPVAPVHARRPAGCTTPSTPCAGRWSRRRRRSCRRPGATSIAAAATGQPFRYLWLLSRGPMSHGCTHVNAGHIAELRQMLPAETSSSVRGRPLPQHVAPRYDVFDIDGDFTPEVMGVRYFIAYSLKDNQPDRLRVAQRAARLLRLALRRRARIRRRRPRPLRRRHGRPLRRARGRGRLGLRRHRPVRGRLRRRRRSSSIGWSTSRSPRSCARSASPIRSPVCWRRPARGDDASATRPGRVRAAPGPDATASGRPRSRGPDAPR